MQLTGIQKLSKDYTSDDSKEMATVMLSTHQSSPAAEIRFGKVKFAVAQAWMREQVSSSLKGEFQVERMSEVLDLNQPEPSSVPCAEHLIIRDLDMKLNDDGAGSEATGHIVAHADWRYTPCFNGKIADTPTGVNSMQDGGSFPEGFNTELHNLLNDGISSSVATHFNGLPFFYLLGISTLTPSHLRKGIAKMLVQWVDPYVDGYSVPVVLYASPVGLHLYRSCGYEEYRDLDVAIDLEKWGVQETHRHVVMIRWPKDDSRLSDAWKEWRKAHKSA